MKITWWPIRVGVGSFDAEEQMVLVGGKLVDQKGHSPADPTIPSGNGVGPAYQIPV